MENKITVQLYADKYGDNNLVESILNKNFAFELQIENEKERSRRIISYYELKKLKTSIDDSIKAYEDTLKHDFVL